MTKHEKIILDKLLGRHFILVKYNTKGEYTSYLQRSKRTYTAKELIRMEGKWNYFHRSNKGLPYFVEHIDEPYRPLRWKSELINWYPGKEGPKLV